MTFKEQEILEAYKIYSQLASEGTVNAAEAKSYLRDDKIEELVDRFAKSDDAVIITAGDTLYLVPMATTSPFHMNNETIKKLYLPSSATNLDIYMMYVAIIILLGEFYNSYQTQEPTRNFIHMGEWLDAMNTRIESLSQIDEETLQAVEEEHEYNWSKIIEKWLALDDIKEKAKKQTGNTNSRMSFLNLTKSFLEKQDMITDIGNNELEITEKTKVIIQRYYMDYEYNRGLLDFIYQFGSGEIATEESGGHEAYGDSQTIEDGQVLENDQDIEDSRALENSQSIESGQALELDANKIVYEETQAAVTKDEDDLEQVIADEMMNSGKEEA